MGRNKSMLKYSKRELKNKKATIKFEFNLQKILKLFALDRCEAEKQVLYNIRKFDRMQFMGLRDKNGSLIYFGDILIDDNNNLLTPVCEVSNGEHILFFKPLQHLNKKISIGCKSTYSNTLEVIGNIYVNSELFAGVQEKDKIVNIAAILKNMTTIQTTIQFETTKPVCDKI